MRRCRVARPNLEGSAFAGFRFPPEAITVAVRWYLRYGLSYCDIEESRQQDHRRPPVLHPCLAARACTGRGHHRQGPYLRVLAELVPTAAHVTEQYANKSGRS